MRKIGIYIHIPFCIRKCKYCDFISFDKYDKCMYEKYIESVEKEIDNINMTCQVESIYFGGGTPSLISYVLIDRLLKKIKQKFDVLSNCEITIEINPGTVNIEKLSKYKEIGINRLSIGLQSTNDRILKLVGRIHNYDEFLNVYNGARNIGFDNINVDLMLGLPTQTLDDIIQSVGDVVKLEPEHISLYSLILEEGTELEKMVNNNILQLPNEDLEREMYWKTKELLEESGYIHYEISNFSKLGYESRHNLNCWNQKEYIGFGIAAHSYMDKKRFSNTDDINKYIENINSKRFDNNKIIQENSQIIFDEMREYMMLGLRKIEGIQFDLFEKKFQKKCNEIFSNEIKYLQENNLIIVSENNIMLSNEGLDFANIVFEKFV